MKVPSVTKEEFLDAVRQGVSDGVCMSREEMADAISRGVYDAMWQMITNATEMPCNDFYATVGNAVERAMLQVKVARDD